MRAGPEKSVVSQVFVIVGGVQSLQHFRHLLANFSLLVTCIALVKTSHSKTLASGFGEGGRGGTNAQYTLFFIRTFRLRFSKILRTC